MQRHPGDLHFRQVSVGRAAPPTRLNDHPCKIRRTNYQITTSLRGAARRRGNLRPLRCKAPPVPSGDGKRTDCHGPDGPRNDVVVLTGCNDSRTAITEAGRRGQCHTPYNQKTPHPGSDGAFFIGCAVRSALLPPIYHGRSGASAGRRGHSATAGPGRSGRPPIWGADPGRSGPPIAGPPRRIP